MTFRDMRIAFEQNTGVYESSLITFHGADGYDVYNCSVPFLYKGVQHLFGRVERREQWVGSRVRLFVQSGKDEFTLVPDEKIYQLEDPFIAKVGTEMVFGGTQVLKNKNECSGYYCDFYRGSPSHLDYFTTGPDRMKDIRIVQLQDGSIGIFSHHKTHNSCLTGYITIPSLDDLTMDVIQAAKPIDHGPFKDAWGGVNQAYLLSSGKIGCISHHGYVDKDANDEQLNVYCITSFVYEPSTNATHSFRVIGTKRCFPDSPVKAPRVADCAFVSGIVMREDGKCDLYSGVGDTCEGRITIDYPFEGHGHIADNLVF